MISALYYDPDTFAECSFLAFDDDRLIILCDPEGNEVWRYDGDENCQYDNFPKAIFTSTNEIIVGCGDYDPDFDPPFEHQEGFYIPTVSKLNMDGEELWSVPIGEHGISASVFSVVETEEGDFVAVGTRFSLVGGQWEGFVAKISSEGAILWNHNYRYEPDRPSRLHDVAILSDGRIACSGLAEISVGNNARESWVMVLDQDGCLEEDCGTAVNENPESPFSIYPNPATNQLNLSWSTTIHGKALVRMTTLAGKIVLEEETTTSQQHTIDTSALAEGFYLLTVQMNNQWYVEKVVVRGE
ncbi:MAG: T9SS type A sorting domain-containing protein [Flavobacteriales bacterium]|nr:T9SS type A sorting domain-containing protein [Flavobacteriales bacterium]MDG1779980.1 T9SS type A sorting domain-containing protein [Flavobacteriales bacterium]MDG2247279.1 T9SS type A sorting domain-containing protein [Flavobacteriales bacterium]